MGFRYKKILHLAEHVFFRVWNTCPFNSRRTVRTCHGEVSVTLADTCSLPKRTLLPKSAGEVFPALTEICSGVVFFAAGYRYCLSFLISLSESPVVFSKYSIQNRLFGQFNTYIKNILHLRPFVQRETFLLNQRSAKYGMLI